MSNQFKPGDLALTLIDLPPVMAGSVVELVERVAKGDLIHTPHGMLQATANGWICAHPEAPGNIGFCDTALMPLRGEFQPERQKATEVPA